MKETHGGHKTVILLFVAIVMLSIVMIEFLNRSQASFVRDGLLTRAKEELSIIRSELEAAIVSDIYIANSLSALVSANPDIQFVNWISLASSIKRKSSHIQVIGLAPNDVVEYVYPIKGNEEVIGLDYRSVPTQWRSIKKAKEIEEIFISGPVSLVQGGNALIARVPIFVDPPLNLRYWGVCSIVLNLDTLYLDVGIPAFAYKYHLAIRGVDSAGKDGELFYGEQTTFDNAFAVEEVHFPYGSWVIAAAAKDNLIEQVPWYRVHIARVLGYPVILMLLLAFGTIYHLYTLAYERSLHDELTRLPNRRYFIYTLKHHFDTVARNKKGDVFAILNIDIDKFKSINDNYGHAAGDKVLIACAERIRSTLRATDVVARMGGDEFLVLLPRISKPEDVDMINIELQKAICHTPVIYEQHLINLSVSVGYALYKPEFDDIHQMMKLADTRMYEEKRRQSAYFL
ncbi:diguanylate cyclase [Vibrio sp. TRT 17S01]|uniref:diguanylate cyclase n=1 Tax=Vibrio sp. TRT 17S01 TaxID=3418505 RepID=UPI003CFA9D56